MSLQDILKNGSNPPPSWSRLRVASIFSDETIAGGDFNVIGDFGVQGDSQFSGAVVMTDSLDVALASVFQDDLQVGGTLEGVEASFSQDVLCRNLQTSIDVICGNDLSVNQDLTTSSLTVSALGKFNSSCQCVAGVNIGNTLNVDHTIDQYYTKKYVAIVVTNSNEVADIRYCRVGNAVTISVVATVAANAGFIANGAANLHLTTSTYPDIAAAITTDLAGRSMHFSGLVQVGVLFQPGGITLAADGAISMFECDSGGIMTAGGTFYNFSICYSVI